jgi:hypothetical protein
MRVRADSELDRLVRQNTEDATRRIERSRVGRAERSGSKDTPETSSGAESSQPASEGEPQGSKHGQQRDFLADDDQLSEEQVLRAQRFLNRFTNLQENQYMRFYKRMNERVRLQVAAPCTASGSLLNLL